MFGASEYLVPLTTIPAASYVPLSFVTCFTGEHCNQGEHYHQWVKDVASVRTNNRETDLQLGEMDYSLSQIIRIAEELRDNGVLVHGKGRTPISTTEVLQEMEVSISRSSRLKKYLPNWLRKYRCDPALTVTCQLCHPTDTNEKTLQGFMELLLLHIRERLFPNGDETEQIFIKNNTLHEHPLLNIEYTSYEVQREQDIVHVGYGRTGILVYT